MTSGGLALALLGLGIGTWLWHRERRWRQHWQALAADLHLQHDAETETLTGRIGEAGLIASLQSGRLQVEVILPAGRLGGLAVQRLASGVLQVEAEDDAHASIFLMQPGIGSGLEALLVQPGDRLAGRRLLLERPGREADALPALVAEVGMFLDAVQDAGVRARRPQPRDPFFVSSPSAPRRPLEPMPGEALALPTPRIAPPGGGLGVLPTAAAASAATPGEQGVAVVTVTVVVDRVERTLGGDVPAPLAGGWTVVGDDAAGETCAVRLPPGAALPAVAATLAVRGRVGSPDPFWGWRVVEVEVG